MRGPSMKRRVYLPKGRVLGPTKKQQEAAIRAKRREDFDIWWNECKRRRTLVLSGHIMKGEYEGELPWPEWVSVRALWHDFRAFTGNPATLVEFSAVERERKIVKGRKVKEITTTTDAGRPLSRTRMKLWHIVKMEWQT